MKQNNDIIRDLVFNENFRRWVLKNSTSDQEYWEHWCTNNPGQELNIRQAKLFILKMHQAQESLTQAELENELSRLSRRRSDLETALKPVFSRRNLWRYLAAAVVVLGLTGILYVIYQVNFDSKSLYEARRENLEDQFIEVINQDMTVKSVRLSDGTEIQLSPKSRISYPKTFAGDRREVYLSGEGFFEVTKDTRRPFLVYANELKTRVVGTSFVIRAFDVADKVEVSVRTGKVAVSAIKKNSLKTADEKSPGMILTPNQQAVFDRKEGALLKSLVNKPVLVGKEDERHQRQIFENTPVSKAFETLSAAYGIPIEFDKGALKYCEISAEFYKEGFYQQLDLMCKAIDAQYRTVDTKIIISAKGCKPY